MLTLCSRDTTMEDNSSFFAMPGTPVDEAPVSVVPVHSSQTGSCDIYRIDRMGRFRALKCLKPSFRGNPTYELLLKKEFEIAKKKHELHCLQMETKANDVRAELEVKIWECLRRFKEQGENA